MRSFHFQCSLISIVVFCIRNCSTLFRSTNSLQHTVPNLLRRPTPKLWVFPGFFYSSIVNLQLVFVPWAVTDHSVTAATGWHGTIQATPDNLFPLIIFQVRLDEAPELPIFVPPFGVGRPVKFRLLQQLQITVITGFT
jgi:hypothetical protein